MKLPRDLDAPTLIRALARFGYAVVRQTGSHVRRRTESPTPHAITIPQHSPLRLGTLAAILDDLASHRSLSRDDLIVQLLDR